jgi:predicted transcriptional regulator of viral defense system
MAERTRRRETQRGSPLVSTLDLYARLQKVGRVVLSTGEAASAMGVSMQAAAKLLTRLATSGMVSKVSHGVWQVNRDVPQPAEVAFVLTDPFPSYISGWSALFHHGMIEQIPQAVFVSSLGRTRTTSTTIGPFKIHHIHPGVFGGFEGATGVRCGMATPEKGLFDVVYTLSTQSGVVTLPELELPRNFHHRSLHRWVARIPTRRLQTLTRKNLEQIIAGAQAA